MKKITSIFRFCSISKTIPMIDLAPYLHEKGDWKLTAELIRKASKQIGFFYIINHGISQKLQQQMFQSAKHFFTLPIFDKKQIDINKSGVSWKGYFEYGFEYTSSKPDQKQGIWYGRELNSNHPDVKRGLPLHGSNPFPSKLPTFKKNVLQWLRQMERVGGLLSMAIADSLNLDRRFFIDGMCKDHLGTLGIMHYPYEQKTSYTDWGVSEHTDYGFLTLLMFDQPHLQAQDVNGQWITIDSVPNAFVVNIGDILEVMTQGLYKSTPHRARNCAKTSRYALPYFYDVNWHTQIKPLDIILSQEEQAIADKVKKYSRWDRASLHQTKGIFGHYYCRKLMKSFPSSLQQELTAFLK